MAPQQLPAIQWAIVIPCQWGLYLSPVWVLYLLLLFVILGFGGGVCWYCSLCLQGWYSTIWAIPPTLYALFIFRDGAHFLPRPAWTVILLFYTSWCNQDDRHVPPCSTFFLLISVVSQTFSPELAPKHNPPDPNLPKVLGLQMWIMGALLIISVSLLFSLILVI
jgi:hypothetical protein